MVARNEERLRKECEKLAAAHGVKTRYIVCDLSQALTIDDYRKRIADQVRDLDLAMVFLNAGVFIPGKFESISESQLEQVIRVNFLHGVYLAKALLP